MSKIVLIIAMLFSIALLLKPINAGTGWGWLPNADPLNAYVNAYNFSVNNWLYKATFNGTTYTGVNMSFVLIDIKGINETPLNWNIQTSYNGTSTGNANWFLVNSYLDGNNTRHYIIEIGKKSRSGSFWNIATLYYNYLVPSITNTNLTIYGNINNYEHDIMFKGLTVLIPHNSAYINVKNTAFYANSSIFNLNFTLNTTDTTAFVLFANRNLTNTNFNLTWSVPSYTFRVFSNSSTIRYNLRSLTNLPLFNCNWLFTYCPKVNSTNQTSFNSNLIINNPYGYEGYFASINLLRNLSNYPKYVITEGLTANDLKIANTTNSITTEQMINFAVPVFSLSILANTPVTFLLVPAFTSNYTNSTLLTNPHPGAPPTGICNARGWYYDFIYRVPITNITFNYSFTTNAFDISNFEYPPSHTVIKHTFTYNDAPFAILTIKHYAEMGNNCEYIYLRDYNDSTQTDYGSVPFYVLSCNNQSSTATLLIPNKTVFNYNFNQLYLYYNSSSNMGGAFNNYTIVNNFYVAKDQSSFSINHTFVQILTLSAPLNLNSTIDGSPPLDSIQGGNLGVAYALYEIYGIKHKLYGTQPETVYLINFKDYQKSIYSNTLGVRALVGYQSIVITNASGGYVFTAPFSYSYRMVNLSGPITATDTQIYGNSSTFGGVEQIICNGTGGGYGGLPRTIPYSNTIGVGGVTTTIDFTAISLTSTCLFNGFCTSKLIIVVILLISMLFITLMVGSDHIFYVIGIVIMVVLGLWNIALLVLGIILVIIFTIYEFIEYRGGHT